MAASAFPGCRIVESQRLAGGLRNANFKLRVSASDHLMVLRIYEHDSSLCRKEMDLMALVSSSIPVPEVIHAEPEGLDDLPPFTLMSLVEGQSLRDLEHTGNTQAIAQTAYSAGETLATIARTTFPKSGWLSAGPAVTAPLLEGADPIPRFVDLSLSSVHLAASVPNELRDRVHKLVWSRAANLADLASGTHLVHGDFNGSNLLVRAIAGRWRIAAVLDWEFALSGSPLNDIGNFLRYERAVPALLEPHFSAGYRNAGGTLPEDWRGLARLIDLTALCEKLTHVEPADPAIANLVELIRATVEDRHHELSYPNH